MVKYKVDFGLKLSISEISVLCGYCQGDDHLSEQCPIREQKDHAKFKCVNCKEAGKDFEGHSSHYHKCPTLLEAQKKTKQNIPYYAKNQN